MRSVAVPEAADFEIKRLIQLKRTIEAERRAQKASGPTDACVVEQNPPLWTPPAEFAAQNGRLSGAARAVKASRGKEVQLALSPTGMSYVSQIEVLTKHGITTEEGKPVGLSTLRRWWDEMTRDGLVQREDARRPSRSRAR